MNVKNMNAKKIKRRKNGEKINLKIIWNNTNPHQRVISVKTKIKNNEGAINTINKKKNQKMKMKKKKKIKTIKLNQELMILIKGNASIFLIYKIFGKNRKCFL